MLAVLVALGVGAAVWAYRFEPEAAAPFARGRSVAAGAVALAVAVVAGAALVEGPPAERSGATSASRFRTAESTRYAYWQTALEAFADDPLRGTGSGGFAVEWRREPNRPERAVDAHSLYIETLSELGLPGVAFLLLFLGGVGVSAARLHARDAAAAAGPAAALAVWAVHSGVDWDWEMPAVTGFALLLAAALIGWADTGSRQTAIRSRDWSRRSRSSVKSSTPMAAASGSWPARSRPRRRSYSRWRTRLGTSRRSRSGSARSSRSSFACSRATIAR